MTGKTQLFLLLFCGLCSFSSNNFATEIQYTEGEADRLADSFSACGYNGASRSGIYNTQTFEASAFIETLKKKNGSCYRSYSANSAQAVSMYQFHISKENTDRFSSYSCVNEFLSVYSSELIKYMNDPETASVVADLFDTETADTLDGTSEDCAFFNFYVFRKNGTVLNIEFNYTD